MNGIVLITGIGGDIAQGVATIIRENRPELRMLGVDVHQQHGGRSLVDHYCSVPRADAPGYVAAIQAAIITYGVNLAIPMTEPELATLTPFNELTPGLKWITSGEQAVSAGLDKFKTMLALARLGVPVPWTVPVGDAGTVPLPCILKNRFGSGSRAVFVVTDDEEANYLARRYPDAVFQEMLEPAEREVTCAVYRTRDGRTSSLLMRRRLTGGFTGWAKIIKDDETSRMCEIIAEGLQLQGSMNIQLRLTDKGPRVFEINPRFSSTVLMRHRLGFSDVLWALDEAEGKPVTFPCIPEHQVVARSQGARVLTFEERGDHE